MLLAYAANGTVTPHLFLISILQNYMKFRAGLNQTLLFKVDNDYDINIGENIIVSLGNHAVAWFVVLRMSMHEHEILHYNIANVYITSITTSRIKIDY